jgi:DNA-binding PadR family transcriptional regulator
MNQNDDQEVTMPRPFLPPPFGSDPVFIAAAPGPFEAPVDDILYVDDDPPYRGRGRGRRRMPTAMYIRDLPPDFVPDPGFAGPGFAGPGLRGPHGRGRRRRGDIRAAVLQLLLAGPKHGYQLIQEISERSGGAWTPSPGSMYPTIAQLEDEGLVTVTMEEGRKTIALTDAGRTAAESYEGPEPWQAATRGQRDVGKLWTSVGAFMAAVKQVGKTGQPDQIERARVLVDKARRELYLMLAEDPPEESSAGSPSSAGEA